MKAYHNQIEIKNKFVERVKAHRAADELVKMATKGRQADGTFKGCAVVCTLEVYNHAPPTRRNWEFRECWRGWRTAYLKIYRTIWQ